ncbi:hypothetical protein SAMD00019534_033180 [Acytostelium subglobosum LB1]|uniref:hypothetical protein n=1 Tax=Acytostelium subglobosum LB1 TaxID=1410327 RepID=UPI00064518C1|nr:hypothetical protein SAMD00019534_033180 [Acytostelium subglobosum LB1]GAM20143.1 hypothetical protein SAMD00019534_033180 [Acytostelium subglobosum LB1]|eukprot:XP_012759664.1 hypothetical protein SAMD00019534_033180 [Acytostelium subglobosum LB1]
MINCNWILGTSEHDAVLTDIVSLQPKQQQQQQQQPHGDIEGRYVTVIRPQDCKEQCALTIKFETAVLLHDIVVCSQARLVEVYSGELDDYLVTMKALQINEDDDPVDKYEAQHHFNSRVNATNLKIKFCSLLEKDKNRISKVYVLYTKVETNNSNGMDMMGMDKENSLNSMMAIMSMLTKTSDSFQGLQQMSNTKSSTQSHVPPPHVPPTPSSVTAMALPPKPINHHQQQPQQQNTISTNVATHPLVGTDNIALIQSMLDKMEQRINNKFEVILSRIEAIEQKLEK